MLQSDARITALLDARARVPVRRGAWSRGPRPRRAARRPAPGRGGARSRLAVALARTTCPPGVKQGLGYGLTFSTTFFYGFSPYYLHNTHSHTAVRPYVLAVQTCSMLMSMLPAYRQLNVQVVWPYMGSGQWIKWTMDSESQKTPRLVACWYIRQSCRWWRNLVPQGALLSGIGR